MLIGKRIVDLSHEMWAGQEEYGLEINTRLIEEVYPQYKRREDVWYTLQTVQMSSHIGTHIEFPRHFDPNGLDCAEFPLDRLIGPACRLDFRHKGDSELITLEEISAYDDLIQTGDIVFLWTGRWAKRGTPEGHARPCLSPEATLWLARDKDVPVIGVDATGIEVKGTDYHPDHTILLKQYQRGLIEEVGDLGQLRSNRFQIWILPLRMHGLESSPIRLLAIEDEEPST